jgi:hypothetical protein
MTDLVCPALIPEGREGDSLVYSYRSLTSGRKILIKVPPKAGPHCNRNTGEWIVEGPLTPTPDIPPEKTEKK